MKNPKHFEIKGYAPSEATKKSLVVLAVAGSVSMAEHLFYLIYLIL
jgi:hypothetical protein